MRIVAKILLIILFIPLFLIGLLLANIKFQALNTNFWLSTFTENNVYENLANVFKEVSEKKIADGGGNLNDAGVLTDLITEDNLKDITSKNLVNLLGFVNGKVNKLEVYIPITKLPKDLLPTNLGSKPDTIPISQLLKSLNITQVSESQIAMISQGGFLTTLLFFTDSFLLALVLFLLFILTKAGKRFWAVGIALTLSGIIVLAAFAYIEFVRQRMISSWQQGSEPIQLALSSFAPFIIEKMTLVWLITGIVCLILGILLFFIKRQVYNIRK